MYGYKIKFDGLPQKLFACSVNVNNYIWQNRNSKNTIEISVGNIKRFETVVGKKEYVLENTSHISCIVGDDERYARSDTGDTVEITSVAVCFDNLTYEACELCFGDADDNSVYLLPAMSSDFTRINSIVRLLNQYISCSVSDKAYDRAMSLSVWFEMIYIIDSETRFYLKNARTAGANYYVSKINYIIEKHYADDISLFKIADEFGVSLSYLSDVYARATHSTFSQALLDVRMKKLRELVCTQKLTADEMAEMTGFCDGSYLRKRFKKYFGVSIGEYRKINNEMTLYHDKPER